MGEMPEKIWAWMGFQDNGSWDHKPCPCTSHESLPYVPESKLTEALAEIEAIGKDLERQVDLNHAQLQEIERLRGALAFYADEWGISAYLKQVRNGENLRVKWLKTTANALARH